MKSFLAALSFFTRIPLRVRFAVDDALFQRGIKYLPVVAIVIGIPVSAAAFLAQWIGPYLAAFIALAVYLLMSGGLHVDGMADTMDAFGSNKDRQTMLDIMKDSRIGTFGVLSVVVYVAGMVACLAQTDYWLAVLFPLVGRTSALLGARLFHYARVDGTGKRFVDGVQPIHIAVAMLVYVIAAWLGCLRFGVFFFSAEYAMIIFAPYVFSLAVVILVMRGMAAKLGGITGDVIGFGIETTQLVYLLSAAVLTNVLWI